MSNKKFEDHTLLESGGKGLKSAVWSAMSSILLWKEEQNKKKKT